MEQFFPSQSWVFLSVLWHFCKKIVFVIEENYYIITWCLGTSELASRKKYRVRYCNNIAILNLGFDGIESVVVAVKLNNAHKPHTYRLNDLYQIE